MGSVLVIEEPPTHLRSIAMGILLPFADRLGYGVSFSRPPNPKACGYTDYSRRQLWVDPNGLDSFEAALVLLHELGHAAAAERMGFGSRTQHPRRRLQRLRTTEERAYLYGWAVAVRGGLTGPDGLTRETWRLFNGIEVTRG